MARALVLGESDLDPADDAAFRSSGLSHLLAVSGMHLVLVVVGAAMALRALLARFEWIAARLDPGRVAAALGVPIAWAYASFAGGSGSAFRAAWMLTAAFAARALGRRGDASRAFALSLVAMALVDPLVVHDVSFVLSAAATGGLLFASEPIRGFIAARLPAELFGREWLARSHETFFRQLSRRPWRPRPTRRPLEEVGQPPGARIRSDMIYFKTDRVTPADTEAVARIVLEVERRRGRAVDADGSTTALTRRRASGASGSTCIASAARSRW